MTLGRTTGCSRSANRSPRQLAAPCPGTYGPILETLRHLVGSDAWYLWIITADRRFESIGEDAMGVSELRSAARVNAAAWQSFISLTSTRTRTSCGAAKAGSTTRRWAFASPRSSTTGRITGARSARRSRASGSSRPRSTRWAYGDATGRNRMIGERPPDE